MSAYSPFDKELKDLEAEDLTVLKGVTEGWYVEYKRSVPNASSIAKSISAFANTYGGWLFCGIEQQSRENSVAGTFLGISRPHVDAALQCMRQASATHVNPPPHFDTKVVWGPCQSIGLAADHAIVCIRIPWSSVAPHVHKGGHVYRRVADGSEPKPENDRFVLDQLWQRAKRLRKQCKTWIECDPKFSREERERPYVRLLLVADLWRDRDVWTEITLDEARSIFTGSQYTVYGIPFDNVYTSANGFIARQLKENDPQLLGLTWRFNRRLDSEVIIPLNLHVSDSFEILRDELQGYVGTQSFVEMLEKYGHRAPRIIDLNFLFNLLIGVVETQQRLLKSVAWIQGYFIKARLLNVWRTTPFVDVPLILNEFQRHGVPMCLDSKITTPSGTDPSTFVEISDFADIDDQHDRFLSQALSIFAPIANAFGLPAWIEHSKDETSEPYYIQLQRAGQRAMDVQLRRIEGKQMSGSS